MIKQVRKIAVYLTALAAVGFYPTGAVLASPKSPATSWIEKTLEYRLDDGVRIKVHFTEQMLKTHKAERDFGSQVLDDFLLLAVDPTG